MMTLHDDVDAAAARNAAIPASARLQVVNSPIRDRVQDVQSQEVSELTYDQRKALRRISRGKSIPHRMVVDPLISRCFEWSTPLAPPKPVAHMNIIEYCDWEARVTSACPVLNEFGKNLLSRLETSVAHSANEDAEIEEQK
jgi:hypothetical protein